MGCLFRPFFGAFLTAVVFVAVVSLFFAGQINDGAFAVNHDQPSYDLVVKSLADGSIGLAGLKHEPAVLRQDGTFGLIWDGGYGQVGKILDPHADHVTREFTPVSGILGVGTKARLDSYAYRGDPSDRGLPFTQVTYDSALGPMKAWQVPGSSDTWAIFVHGKGSSIEEGLRILPTIRDAGMPSLVIEYRNDDGAPESPDKRYGYGHEEWQDVGTAMDYAKTQGARRFVLFGNSMGGAIIMATMEQPTYASQVIGLVMDAPVLDLKKTVEYRAALKKAPSPLTWVSLQLTARLYKLDWSKFSYLKDADDLRVPVLLFHGDADRVVPVTTSDNFAQRRHDIVTYKRVPGAGHVLSWNADPDAYQSALKDFLTGLR